MIFVLCLILQSEHCPLCYMKTQSCSHSCQTRMDVGLAPKQRGDLLVVGLKVSEGARFGSLACVGIVEVTCAFVFLITSIKSTCAALRAWQP